MSRRCIARLAPLALVLALSLSGCGDGDDTKPANPSTSADEGDGIAITVTRKDDIFTPNGERVDVEIGQTVTLNITSDVEGEFHVHSVPEQEVSYEAGTSEHEITIDRPGVVEVESHEPASIVLQLEVR